MLVDERMLKFFESAEFVEPLGAHEVNHIVISAFRIQKNWYVPLAELDVLPWKETPRSVRKTLLAISMQCFIFLHMSSWDKISAAETMYSKIAKSLKDGLNEGEREELRNWVFDRLADWTNEKLG